jgi:RNA polymerase primary sigma factor
MAARQTTTELSLSPSGLAAAATVSLSRSAKKISESEQAQLFRLWHQGTTPEVLAERYGLSRLAVSRLINQVRAMRVLEQKLEFIPHPSFDDRSMRSVILGPMPAAPEGRGSRRSEVPEGVPPYLASLYEVPLLTREQEMHLFRKMNFLKYQASRLRANLVPERAKTSELHEIERLQEESLVVKNQIIRANLRLVVSIAKKYIGTEQGFFELVSDGNVSLIRAVEKFDFSRGNKFSTYASWAVMKNFARSIPGERQQRDRFRTGQDDIFLGAADARSDEHEVETSQQHSQETVRDLLHRLEDRERRILVRRFGLDGEAEQTLEQLGRDLGITKERVRQIEARAREKLRKIAVERGLDLAVA